MKDIEQRMAEASYRIRSRVGNVAPAKESDMIIRQINIDCKCTSSVHLENSEMNNYIGVPKKKTKIRKRNK